VVVLSEGFDGSWSYLIWGGSGSGIQPLRLTPKKKALDAARAYSTEYSLLERRKRDYEM
jgi:hypothetical protein